MTILSEKLESINRVVRQTAAAKEITADATATNHVDHVDGAASEQQKVESKAPAIDDLSLDNEESDDNRNKR